MSHKTWVVLELEGRHLLVQVVVLLAMQRLAICLFATSAGLPTPIVDLVLRVGPLHMVGLRRQLRTMECHLKIRMEGIKRHQHTHPVHPVFHSNSQLCPQA